LSAAAWFLTRVAGLRLATEMLLTNRRLSAAEAKAAGIVTEVIAESELAAAANKLARRIAAGPPGAFGSVKRLLRASATNTLGEQLEAEAAEIARNASLPDGREGVAAFLEKRRPRFGPESSRSPTGWSTRDPDFRRSERLPGSGMATKH